MMSAQFNETNNVDLGTGLNPSGAEMSVSAWVYLDSDVGPADARVVCKGGTSAGGQEYCLRVSASSDRPQFSASVNAGTQLTTSLAGVATLALNTWHHLVGVRRGSAVEIWANGVLENSNGATAGDMDTSADEAWLGDQPSTADRQLDGRVAKPQIFDYALTEAEILSIFNSHGLDGLIPLSQYLLDEGVVGVAIAASVVVDSGPAREPNGSGEGAPVYGADEAIIFRRRYR